MSPQFVLQNFINYLQLAREQSDSVNFVYTMPVCLLLLKRDSNTVTGEGTRDLGEGFLTYLDLGKEIVNQRL